VKVGVDGRALSADRAIRGVARYLRCLLAELERAFPDDEYRLLVRGRATYVAGSVTGRPRLDRALDGCDVFWTPAPAPLALSRDMPLVLTVHDLSFAHRAADYTPYERLWHRLARPPSLARRARTVIAVSAVVRDELISEWGLAPDRIVCVHNGPGLPAGRAGPLPDGLAPGFLLAVGALEPRKRPDLLAAAYERARAAGLRAPLAVVGASRDDGGLGAAGALLLGRVPDEQLEALYGSALGLVCASREEGFGLTPVEAAARGAPSVVPDLPVFAETLGEAVLRFTPGDSQSLADALLRLEGDGALRDRVAAEARTAAARLSWERAARETRAVLAGAAA
jgi:glycosyltransferase involved in cell wall biosynthesis